MRYLLGILGIILFVGLVFGSVYFSIFDPNMNLMVAGLVIAIVILVAVWKVKKKKREKKKWSGMLGSTRLLST